MSKTLKLNPTSINKPSTYRWFQSQHMKVNTIVSQLSVYFEDLLKLKETP